MFSGIDFHMAMSQAQCVVICTICWHCVNFVPSHGTMTLVVFANPGHAMRRPSLQHHAVTPAT
jgi:hypothetical protein